ncbi:MAG: glycosyltransferase family 2 protein [Pseudomonadota bacterium]
MKTIRTLAIVVNYHAAALSLEAVQSVLSSQSLGPIQVVLADNSTDTSEAAFLRKHLPDAVMLRVNTDNMGFGRACNVIADEHDADLILLLNPDARLLPGCLIRLQQTLLSCGRIGAVGPQIYWDRKNGYFLPPSYPPMFFWVEPLISIWGPYSRLWRLLSAIWRRFAVYVWRARSPVRVTNLSGGHVLLKKDAIVAAGGLFDPRFFLYYEDTDLFVRLKNAGYRLVVEPRAEVVHLYDQCDPHHLADKRSHMIASQRLFREKHMRGWKSYLNRLAIRFRKEPDFSIEPKAKPTYNCPFRVLVPDNLAGGWLFEWSPNSNFIPAAGRFGTGVQMVFTENEWNLLSPGVYYGRLSSITGWGMPVLEISWEKLRTA